VAARANEWATFLMGREANGPNTDLGRKKKIRRERKRYRYGEEEAEKNMVEILSLCY
jgi:hypothetical protein